jgi:hypothetical protein
LHLAGEHRESAVVVDLVWQRQVLGKCHGCKPEPLRLRDNLFGSANTVVGEVRVCGSL